jgi:hypothetical protein
VCHAAWTIAHPNQCKPAPNPMIHRVIPPAIATARARGGCYLLGSRRAQDGACTTCTYYLLCTYGYFVQDSDMGKKRTS